MFPTLFSAAASLDLKFPPLRVLIEISLVPIDSQSLSAPLVSMRYLCSWVRGLTEVLSRQTQAVFAGRPVCAWPPLG